jgi:hypothetical protein
MLNFSYRVVKIKVLFFHVTFKNSIHGQLGALQMTGVLFSLGSYNKYHRLDGLKNKPVFLTVLEPDIQDLGSSMIWLLLIALFFV